MLYLVAILGISLLAGGCAGLIQGKKSRQTSSVVDFLYPNKSDAIDKPSIPVLTLPINVGIAFVPSSTRRYPDRQLDANQKRVLMKNIADEFRAYKFIRNIEIIPTAYLRPGGSFDNLDQVKTMYGIDIIVLLSYDQVQYTDEGFVSLSYWTIVGAYVFKGEKNDTSTLIDATVYDIASHKMLFRAPGISQLKGAATFVNQSEELRADSKKGFDIAANNLVTNLKAELERFRKRIKERPGEIKIIRSHGYIGGGYMGWDFTLLLLVLAGAAICYGRRKRPV